MSQGESGPRSTSRQASRSPDRTADSGSSPALQRSHGLQDAPRSRPLHDPGGPALIQGDGTGQQGGTRPPDTRDILNPVMTHGGLAEQPPSFPVPPAMGGNHHQPIMGPGQYGTAGSPSRRFSYPSPGATTPRSTTQPIPATASPVGPPTSAGRGSPQTVHPYPMAARRILTPKSPRAVSLSRAAMRTVEVQHLAMGISAATTRGAISAQDTQGYGGGYASLATPPPAQNSTHGQAAVARSPTRPTSGLSRSLSQPSLSQGLPPTLPPGPSPSTSVKREHSGRPVPTGLPFPSALPTNRPLGTFESLGDGSWGSGYVTALPAGAARNFDLTEGQPLLAISPEHGEEIVVEVDVHQASIHSDQKRQRNAGASARFRQRKKEREKELQEEMQKLENGRRELERRIEELARRYQDLEAERDFYRNERNRLRDGLYQMPGGQEWVGRGPPSPVPRTAGASFTSESNPLLAPHPPLPALQAPPPQPQHHAAAFRQPLAQPLAHTHPRSSSYGEIEPPARRRRTDSEPQLPTSSYSLMAPTTLPPIASPIPPPSHRPAFSIPPSPHVTPPPGAARLPPLRFDPARTPSTTPPPVPTGPPPPAIPPHPGSPYATSRKLPYETGWATDTRPPNEGGPK